MTQEGSKIVSELRPLMWPFTAISFRMAGWSAYQFQIQISKTNWNSSQSDSFPVFTLSFSLSFSYYTLDFAFFGQQKPLKKKKGSWFFSQFFSAPSKLYVLNEWFLGVKRKLKNLTNNFKFNY